jgi:hypothetical protein
MVLNPSLAAPYCPTDSAYCAQEIYFGSVVLWLTPSDGAHAIILKKFDTPSEYHAILSINMNQGS